MLDRCVLILLLAATSNLSSGQSFDEQYDHWPEDLTLGGRVLIDNGLQDYAQAAADPEVIANEYIVEMEHPGGGTVKVVGQPIKLSDTPTAPSPAAPELGQHTEEILLELGYEWEQIAALGDAGAI